MGCTCSFPLLRRHLNVPLFRAPICPPNSSTGSMNLIFFIFLPAMPNDAIFFHHPPHPENCQGSMMRPWSITIAIVFAPGGPTRPSRPRLGQMGPISLIEKHFVLLPIICSFPTFCKSMTYSLQSRRLSSRSDHANR